MRPTTEPSLKDRGRKLGLCIGINDYPGTDSDLNGCVNDANDWARALGERGFQVTKVLNNRATRRAILSAIRGVLAHAEAGDSVVIQFSGHGSYVPDLDGDEADGTDECLCPHDVDRAGPITDDELFTLFAARQAGVRLVTISDSCHSGGIARYAPIANLGTTRGARGHIRRTRFLPPAAFLSKRKLAPLGVRRATRVASPPGRNAGLLMAACQDHESSWDDWFDDRANGAFSRAALQCLGRLPARSTYREWMTAIRRMLPSQQYTQSPQLFGTSSTKAWQALT